MKADELVLVPASKPEGVTTRVFNQLTNIIEASSTITEKQRAQAQKLRGDLERRYIDLPSPIKKQRLACQECDLLTIQTCSGCAVAMCDKHINFCKRRSIVGTCTDVCPKCRDEMECGCFACKSVMMMMNPRRGRIY